RVADRGGQEPRRLLRRRGDDILQPRRMAEVRLGRLGLIVAAADLASERSADRHRDGELASGTVAHLGGLGDDLVEGRVDEVHEHYFWDRSLAVQRNRDRGADYLAVREQRA